MKTKPDTNSDYPCPAFTALDFERLWHYYKFDGITLTIENYAAEILIEVPMMAELPFKAFGHRVRITLKGENGKTASRMPRLDWATPEKAEDEIWKLHNSLRAPA